MPDAMAVFAPNANSYRRLRPDMFAPVEPNWGVNHRVVSVRVPESDENNLRFEHRVAGADANPYLVMAAVVAGAFATDFRRGHGDSKNQDEDGQWRSETEDIENGSELVEIFNPADLYAELPDRSGGKSSSGVVAFMPALQDAEWEWLEALLEHVNPYTGLAYQDDPALAFIEVMDLAALYLQVVIFERAFSRGALVFDRVSNLVWRLIRCHALLNCGVDRPE